MELTRNEIKRDINELIKLLNKKDKVYKIDKKRLIGDAETTLSPCKIIIGTYEIYNKQIEINNYDYINILVSIFHEREHLNQQKQIKSILKNENSYDLLFNQIAFLVSYCGYYSPQISLNNYFSNIREIKAEYAGIMNAYEYLSNNYSDSFAQDLIFAYVANRCCDPYFIKIKDWITSIDEIDELFNKAYEKALTEPKQYISGYEDKDEAIKEGLSISPDFIKDFNNFANPDDQDKILTALYLRALDRQHDTELYEMFPLLSECRPECDKVLHNYIVEKEKATDLSNALDEESEEGYMIINGKKYYEDDAIPVELLEKNKYNHYSSKIDEISQSHQLVQLKNNKKSENKKDINEELEL